MDKSHTVTPAHLARRRRRVAEALDQVSVREHRKVVYTSATPSNKSTNK